MNKKNHFGTVDSGHYTSAALVNGRWILFNDSNAREINEKEVITENAYVLLYKRQAVGGTNYGKEVALKMLDSH